MANKHFKKWLLQMPVGFIMIVTGIMVIMYGANKSTPDDWFFWGMASAVIISLGIIILGNAFVHKVKSDLIRREGKKFRQADDEDDII